jgi:hypothetical protein
MDSLVLAQGPGLPWARWCGDHEQDWCPAEVDHGGRWVPAGRDAPVTVGGAGLRGHDRQFGTKRPEIRALRCRNDDHYLDGTAMPRTGPVARSTERPVRLWYPF